MQICRVGTDDPIMGSSGVVGVLCSAPLGKIQTFCRDVATGILFRRVPPQIAWTTFFALKLQHTVVPLAMTKSLMTGLALAPAAPRHRTVQRRVLRSWPAVWLPQLHERGVSRVAAQLGRELERGHRCQRDSQAGPRRLETTIPSNMFGL